MSSRVSLQQSNGSDHHLPDLSRNPSRASVPPRVTSTASEPAGISRPVSSTGTSTLTPLEQGVVPERPASSIGLRHQAQASNDLATMHGFGSHSIDERVRNQAQSRISVVVGGVYLLAGKWREAITELVGGATTAKSNSDYVWLAKALDLLLISHLMLAWAETDFDVGCTSNSGFNVVV